MPQGIPGCSIGLEPHVPLINQHVGYMVKGYAWRVEQGVFVGPLSCSDASEVQLTDPSL